MKKRACFLGFLAAIIFLLFLANAKAITGFASNRQTNVSINVVGAPASLSITSPANSTYISNNSLLLNFSVSGQQSVWYNLDNGANSTISSFVYFNTSQGSHALYIFANNSDNNVTSKNVSFTVYITTFRVLYEGYRGNTK